GLESPFDEKWFTRGETAEPATTVVDVNGFARVRDEALLAHATQIDPTSKFWFGLPPEVMETIEPQDDYELARIMVNGKAVTPRLAEDEVEDDLFAPVGALSDR
ncbi:MAG TPA: hypothetical protein VHY77_01830, partial [Acidimicrobiales bacterium]|nr:hypothetical protein [Acidimicrobiales bacterium]